MGTIEKSSKQSLANVKDLTVKLHVGRDSTRHRLEIIRLHMDEKIFFQDAR